VRDKGAGTGHILVPSQGSDRMHALASDVLSVRESQLCLPLIVRGRIRRLSSQLNGKAS
jgi:hypothetical protein